MQRLHHPFKQRAKHRPRHAARRHARRAIMTLAVLSFGAVGVTRAQTARSGRSARPRNRAPRRARRAPSAGRRASTCSLRPTANAAPQPGGVLFVGSSSIRLWDSLEQDFQALPIVTKRGFGGSRLSDCSEHVSKLVLPYKPRLVIVYAGDNDLAEGATPADVLTSFKRFVEAVHRELPETRIAYLSIKPSPLRAQLIAQARATNDLIEAYSATVPNLDYIDIYSKMVDADGRPRPELFAPDMLHLNRAGYALWRQEIAAHLGPLADPSGTVAPAPALAVAGVPRAVP
jgi:lysophospholipase L1-like esterase